MFVYVLNQKGEPLMPCKPAIARLLLKEGKAKVKKTRPFTIKLTIETTEYKQQIVAGMDTGSKTIGSAAVTNGQVVYQAETQIRQDVSMKMKRRAMYRRTRRGRKRRYRPARWSNRANSKRSGRLAASIRSKVDSHLRERKQIETILPITEWVVETASFDIHKITNPDVSGKDYQKGNQKGYYNTKAYILDRDKYKCQSGRKVKHSKRLHVHHIKFRSQGGSNSPSNLITLCEGCHTDLHNGEFEIKTKKNLTKHATEMGIIKSQLKKVWKFTETFGYETKFKREQVLKLPKTHVNDAVAISCLNHDYVKQLDVVLHKRHVSSGDFQQFKGRRSEKRIPTGKLFGLRKFDLIMTDKSTGFVKGKRSTGYFTLMDIFNVVIDSTAKVRKNCIRLSARSTTLIGEWQKRLN